MELVVAVFVHALRATQGPLTCQVDAVTNTLVVHGEPIRKYMHLSALGERSQNGACHETSAC